MVEGVGFKLEVVNNNYNHRPIIALSALLQHRVAVMTLEERAIVKDISTLSYNLRQILDKL
jgi:hypothetical protein